MVKMLYVNRNIWLSGERRICTPLTTYLIFNTTLYMSCLNYYSSFKTTM